MNTAPPRGGLRSRLRFLGSWLLGLTLAAYALPRAVNVTWHGVLPSLASVHWPAVLALVGLWLLGLYVHSFLLTAAAPRLTHRRALTLNVTGSAVANVVPLGGAAGVELNRRMMRDWGFDTRTFARYTVLTNLWDVGCKLLLPVVGLVVLSHAGVTVTPLLRTASLAAGTAFVGLVTCAAVLLLSPGGARALGRTLELVVHDVLRLVGRDRELGLATALPDLRQECAALVVRGWLPMSAGIVGYALLQWLLLAVCLHLTGADATWQAALAAFAIERLLTVVPITPGGVGVADLGLVGVLLALGADPAGATAAAVLYRAFVFAVEIPVGGGVLGAWLLSQRRALRRFVRTGRPPLPLPDGPYRVAHVSDVFLPDLGGIETHVDDLVRHQRAAGLDADVLTPPAAAATVDPGWVRRLSVSQARRRVAEYDVVHVHLSVWSPFGVGVARAAITAGVPTLVTVHSLWAGAGGVLRLAALATLRRWPVVWSAVSGAAASTFQRSLRGTAVAVLPNAVDVADWRPPGRRLHDTAPTPSTGPTTLVSVMRLVPRKRPLQLLAVFDEVRRLVPDQDVELVVVGDGPLRRRFERAVARRGLTDNVRVTGRVSRDEVREEVRAATLYVAPAPRESFGIAALEARCVGLPVVASRHSGVDEFVRDRVDGMLVGDDAEMAAAIAELVTDDALRERIATHNRRVAPSHDWADALERTDALYRRAADLVVAELAGQPEPAAQPAPVALAAGA